MIGVIAALDIEIQTLRDKMQDIERATHAGMQFLKGRILNKEIVLVKSGVGKVNAACCVQLLVDKYRVDCIINVGVAGGLAKGLKIGDVVVSEDAMQYDVDASAFGHPIGEIPNMDRTFFPADPKLLRLAKRASEESGIPIHIGRIMTADIGLGDAQVKSQLVETWDGACVEMEGAAVAQASFINDVGYLVIRSISDNADGDAHDTYYASIDESVKPSGDFLLALLRIA